MVEVDVSEWGHIDPATGERERTTVFVREMSARERGTFEMEAATRKGKTVVAGSLNFDALTTTRARLALATCCDANGNLIFKPNDVEFLLLKPVKILDRICEAAKKVNGMTDEDLEEDEEETLKN
jgi:hypothetical protein